MRVYHSAGDSTVLKSGNVDLLQPKLLPMTAEFNVVTTTGGHGDPSNFVPAEVAAFFDRCIGR